MRNSIGNNITMTIFGESHGPCVGVTLDGLPSGFKIDIDFLHEDMLKRKAVGLISTQRHEDDIPEIVSGLFNGYTTGTPLTILIKNKDQHSKDYEKIKGRLRPGHADYTAFKRYKGYQDYRGGGHFSGRLTSCMVAAGSICKQILFAKGVLIGSHLEQLYQLHDMPFSEDIEELNQQIQKVNTMKFAVLDPEMEKPMEEAALQAQKEGDSIGGILETAITGYPAGIGDPIFGALESTLSQILYAIPAVKGVSFGLGFEFANLKGSQANDPFYYDGNIKTKTNHNAGINGGISNGMPIRIHTCVKPTASIYKPQDSVDYTTKENVTLQIVGRHDPCIIHRARIVVDNMISFGLLDAWMSRAALAPFEGEHYES